VAWRLPAFLQLAGLGLDLDIRTTPRVSRCSSEPSPLLTARAPERLTAGRFWALSIAACWASAAASPSASGCLDGVRMRGAGRSASDTLEKVQKLRKNCRVAAMNRRACRLEEPGREPTVETESTRRSLDESDHSRSPATGLAEQTVGLATTTCAAPQQLRHEAAGTGAAGEAARRSAFFQR